MQRDREPLLQEPIDERDPEGPRSAGDEDPPTFPVRCVVLFGRGEEGKVWEPGGGSPCRGDPFARGGWGRRVEEVGVVVV